MTDLAIEHVNVLPMDTEHVLSDRTVLIRQGRISGIIAGGSSHDAAVTVDGRDKYLMPSLSDMHVHIGEPWGPRGSKQHATLPDEAVPEIADEMAMYVANGVLLVRNMDGWPLHLELRRRIQAGLIEGPDIVTAGPIVYGPGSGDIYHCCAMAPGSWAGSPEEAETIVDRDIDGGFDFIKVYNSMAPESYDALIARARARNVKVGGHIPFDVGIMHALRQRQDSIEHLRGYDLDPNHAEIAPMSVERFTYWLRKPDADFEAEALATVAAGSTNVPTMCLIDGMQAAITGNPSDMIPSLAQTPPELVAFCEGFTLFSKEAIEATLATLPPVFRMIRTLHKAGARIMTGTDAPTYFTPPGFSLHRELEIYIEAGLTPWDALFFSTREPARYLGLEQERGQVAPGYVADLILLDANPFEDIRNTRRIAAVVHRGKLLNREWIDRRLAAIAERRKAT